MLFSAPTRGIVGDAVGSFRGISLTLFPRRDDDYITETRYLQQPEGMTSVITGFNASIRIHCRKSMVEVIRFIG